MELLNTEFKRKFSVSTYKNMKLSLAEMSFFKDFVNDTRGALYPVLDKTDDCAEAVENNRYKLTCGKVTRLFCEFFPYATYELTASISGGVAGFLFAFPTFDAVITACEGSVQYSCGDNSTECKLPECDDGIVTLIVSCRPGAFDVYFKNNGAARYLCTFTEDKLKDSSREAFFAESKVALTASGSVVVESVLAYMDNGISIADIRPVRYENGDIITEQGKVYLTASIRMQAGAYQGVFSWVPGTCELELTGAVFYDAGDGKWCGDVASSLLYHRGEKMWYLWVCSFSHGHILGHSVFEGDVRFGVNVVDIKLMEKAPEGADISEFLAFTGDEDPDLFYDEAENRWLMAICRIDPETKGYRYVFFESEKLFGGYKFIGAGKKGAETGGSFVRVNGEIFFICGNDFHAVSDYRIYHKNGMTNAKFDYPDGGFRGWGTLMPIKAGGRTRYYWLTFDRHKGSDYNWSYGNLYCFEAF